MPNNAVTPQRQNQFTPKMKANAKPRLLSSSVWIDSGVVASQHWLTAPIIFGKMHFLLISENEFFHEITWNGMTSFMDFMYALRKPWGDPDPWLVLHQNNREELEFGHCASLAHSLAVKSLHPFHPTHTWLPSRNFTHIKPAFFPAGCSFLSSLITYYRSWICHWVSDRQLMAFL